MLTVVFLIHDSAIQASLMALAVHSVHEQTETSSVLRLVNNMRAKWPQRENTQPKGGYAEWYADDGDHQQK